MRYLSVIIVWISILHISNANEFAKIRLPSDHETEVIGEYSNGCIAGAHGIKPSGEGYQTMRQSRNRHYGHIELIDFIKNMGQFAKSSNQLLLVGDMSQPRGGPMPSNHASHQSGLDVDLWLYDMKPQAFRINDIENLKMQSVVDFYEGQLNNSWREFYFSLIKQAALFKMTDRIFVNPVIKKALCDREPNGSWQYKVRPWVGHDSHFHVRLKCPIGSTSCISQKAIPMESGCNADLDNWIYDQTMAVRMPSKVKKPIKKTATPKKVLPILCNELLN